MKLQKYTPPVYLLEVFGTFFVLFYFFGMPILNSDTTWHLAAGDIMRATGMVMQTNRWSFSAPNEPWYNIAWGWDVAISFVKDKTGNKGFFIFLCLWHALIGAVLAVHLKRRNLHPSAIYSLLTLLMLILMVHDWSRPQTGSILLASVFHYLLYIERKKAHSKAILFGLPLLMAIWANTHGAFIAGFIILGAYGIEALYFHQRAWFELLLKSAILCVLATFINPHGWKLWLCIYQQSNSVVMPYIDEWRPYVLLLDPGADIFIFLMFFAADFKDRSIPLADKLLCLLWTIMALISRRHFALAILLGAPTVAKGLSKWVPKHVPARELQTKRLPAFALMTLGVITVLAVLPLHQWLKRDLVLGNLKIPTAAFEYIHTHYPNKKFMNEYSWGGYLIYLNKGETKIFTDGRARTAYPETVMEQTVQFLKGNYKLYMKLVEQFQVDGVIISTDSTFITQHTLPANWKRVYKDELASVYIIDWK